MSNSRDLGEVLRAWIVAVLRLRPLCYLWNRSPLAETFGEATTKQVYLPVIGLALVGLAPELGLTITRGLQLAGVAAIVALPAAYAWNRSPLADILGEETGWTIYLLVLGVAFVGLIRYVGTALAFPFWVAGILALLSRPLAFAWNRSPVGGYFGTVNGWQLFGLLVGVGFVLFAPYLGTGMDRAFGVAGIWAIFAMSWDIQSGYTGYISFGHSALSGAAGYTVGLLAMHAEGLGGYFPVGSPTEMWTAIPVAIAVTVLLGLIIGAITLRLRGPYFSLITLVAVLLFSRLIIAFNEYTNGVNPIGPAQGLNAYEFDPFLRYYFVIYPLLVIALVLVFIARSNVGLILTTIRENEPAVASAGISPTRFKLWSFVISAVPMAIGGVLLAYFDGRVDPDTFVVVTNSIEMIAIAVLGGLSSILGPFFAAFAFIPLEEAILVEYLEPGLRTWTLWSIVLLVLVFARDGVFRLLWHAAGALGGDEE